MSEIIPFFFPIENAPSVILWGRDNMLLHLSRVKCTVHPCAASRT